MTLPPDFWNTPHASGGYGLAVGLVVGLFLGFYLFSGGRVYSFRWIMGVLVAIVCMLIGILVGQIMHLFWLGYL
jgi:hypothetical protein